jgi:hypothetical protein
MRIIIRICLAAMFALACVGEEASGQETKFSTRVTASFGNSDVAVIYDLTTPKGWSLEECQKVLKEKVRSISYPTVTVHKSECVALVQNRVVEKPVVKKGAKDAPKLAPTPVPVPPVADKKVEPVKASGFRCLLKDIRWTCK